MTVFHAPTERLHRLRREATEALRRRLALEVRTTDEANRALEPLHAPRESGLAALISLGDAPPETDRPPGRTLLNCLVAQDALVFRMAALSTTPLDPPTRPGTPTLLPGTDLDAAFEGPVGTSSAEKRALGERPRQHASRWKAFSPPSTIKAAQGECPNGSTAIWTARSPPSAILPTGSWRMPETNSRTKPPRGSNSSVTGCFGRRGCWEIS